MNCTSLKNSCRMSTNRSYRTKNSMNYSCNYCRSMKKMRNCSYYWNYRN